MKTELPKESDFPPGTEFVIKDGDELYVIVPVPDDVPMGEGAFSWPGGWEAQFPTSANLGDAERDVPFERWLEVARAVLKKRNS